MKTRTISLIGRPNVGKSTIFNRLLGVDRKAITLDLPGVTRDRHYGIMTLGKDTDDETSAIVVDTGGFYPEKVELEKRDKRDGNPFFNEMAEQVKLAIEESDLILFVVDVREGLLPFDQMIAEYLRRGRKDFWVLVNKFDSDKQKGDENAFYALGIDTEQIKIISASHGLGFSVLREDIANHLAKLEDQPESNWAIQKGVLPKEEVVAKIALIGGPNAGKSTLLNKLIGANRAMVSPVAGTTIDPIEGYFDLFFGEEANKLSKDEALYRSDRLIIHHFLQFKDEITKEKELYKNIFEGEDLPAEFRSDIEINEETAPEEELLEEEISEDDQMMMELDAGIEEELEEYASTEEEEESDEEETEATSEEVVAAPVSTNFWRSVKIVDTAGIRRMKNVEGDLETMSVYRSIRCIEESDIVLIMVDATAGINHQDKKLCDLAIERGKSIILLLNKVDLLRDKLKGAKERKEWLEEMRWKIPWLAHVDVIPLSAKDGTNINTLRASLKKSVIQKYEFIPSGKLNRVMSELLDKNPLFPQGGRGAQLKVRYVSMVKTTPPTFLLFSNKSKMIPEHYRRYLQNGIRSNFGLVNTPVHLIFRSGRDLEERADKTKTKETATTTKGLNRKTLSPRERTSGERRPASRTFKGKPTGKMNNNRSRR